MPRGRGNAMSGPASWHTRGGCADAGVRGGGEADKTQESYRLMCPSRQWRVCCGVASGGGGPLPTGYKDP